MARTKVRNNQFYEKRNTSDILSRLVILGLLRIMNKKLIYTQVWGPTDDDVETITVPFFYDFTGGSVTSERFIQDNYLNWTDDECTEAGIKKMDGDYKPLPFGVISLNSTSIDAGNISNRFVMGKYTKREGNDIKSYVSFLYSIPLTMQFQCQIKCDTVNTMWKIEQAFREYFYKNKTFHVNYKGMSVPVRVGFSEALNVEKNNQYTMMQFNDGADIKLSCDFTCETYQPVFDPANERPADQYIRNMTFSMGNNSSDKKEIISTKDMSGAVIATGSDVILEWRNFYGNSDLSYVDILYREYGQDNWQRIDTVENHNFYHWIIPEDFIDEPISFDLIIQGTEDINIHTTPIIKIYPDPDSKIISEENVLVINKGLFFTKEDTCKLPITISYIDQDEELKDINAELNILNGMIDETHPLHMSPVVYNGDINCKKIELRVQEHANPDVYTSFINDNSDIRNWITVC